jgi:hypothetical protein
VAGSFKEHIAKVLNASAVKAQVERHLYYGCAYKYKSLGPNHMGVLNSLTAYQNYGCA